MIIGAKRIKELEMKVVYQGVAGAYSYLAAQNLFPEAQLEGCVTFEEVLDQVYSGAADYGILPVENSTAGRVADVHFLLARTPLNIVKEYFLPVHHQLWGLPEAKLEDIQTAYSHPQALAQCADFLKKRKIEPAAALDTALSCRLISQMKDKTSAAVASDVAGALYGLKKLATDIENIHNNTTRFLVMSRYALNRFEENTVYKTSLLFRVCNIPSALFEALKCFADEGLNLSKIESYLLDGRFVAAQFYVDIEVSGQDIRFIRVLQKLEKVCTTVRVLGSYPSEDKNK